MDESDYVVKEMECEDEELDKSPKLTFEELDESLELTVEEQDESLELKFRNHHISLGLLMVLFSSFSYETNNW